MKSMHEASLKTTAHTPTSGNLPLVGSPYAQLLKAPTFAVEVFMNLSPPLRAPLVLTLVKNCTIHNFSDCSAEEVPALGQVSEVRAP